MVIGATNCRGDYNCTSRGLVVVCVKQSAGMLTHVDAAEATASALGNHTNRTYLETFASIAPLLVLFAAGAVAILLPPNDLSGPGLPTHGGRGAAILGDIIIPDGHGRGFIMKTTRIASYVAQSSNCRPSCFCCAHMTPTNLCGL